MPGSSFCVALTPTHYTQLMAPGASIMRSTKLLSSAVPLVALAMVSIAAPTMASATTMTDVEASVAATKQAMMANPQSSLDLAKRTVMLASALPASKDRTTAMLTGEWLEAEALIYLNQPEAARPAVERLLGVVAQTLPNTKLHGDLLRSRGSIAAMRGDALVAVQDLQQAYEVFRKASIARSQAIALQDLGQIYSDAGDYPRVLEYYQQAAELLPDDPSFSLTTHNNRAEVLRKMHRYGESEAEYLKALTAARNFGSVMLQTRILTNLAGAQTEVGRLDAAQKSIDAAMALSLHGEAAGWQPFVYGISASIAAKRGDNLLAKKLFERTFRGVDFDKSDMMFRDYHQVASRVFEALGEPDQVLRHLKAFQRLDSEARNLTASTSEQLLGARFDYANQNLRISTLKQEQLRRQVEQEREKTWFWTVMLVGFGIAGAIVVGLLAFGIFSMRRARDRITVVNGTLTATNIALKKAVLAKTEFLATTSHEIRTPLNGILGMTQVMLTDRTVAPELRGRIEVVQAAGQTMQALVDDILDVAKMESGELTLSFGPVDLGKLASGAIMLWNGKAATKGIAIDYGPSDPLGLIVSDAARLRQIVFNLMSNAVKFTSEGRVTLRTRVEEGPLGAERVVLSVTDTGMGIPADKFEEIFESFKQVDGGLTRQHGGTGLGLAICKRLTEAMGGTIDVESTIGVGTTFSVRLPLERVAQDVQQLALLEAEGAVLADAHMLLAVPAEANSSLLRMLLLPEVERLDLCADAHQALELLDESEITHLVFDCACVEAVADLPAIVDALVEKAGTRGVRLTFLSATPDQMGTAIWGGLIQMVEKPFNGAKLLNALQQLYGQNEERVPGHPLRLVG